MHEISVTIIPKRHQILKFNLLKSEYISGAYTSSIIYPKITSRLWRGIITANQRVHFPKEKYQSQPQHLF